MLFIVSKDSSLARDAFADATAKKNHKKEKKITMEFSNKTYLYAFLPVVV